MCVYVMVLSKGNWTKVLVAVHAMRKSGMVPNSYTYNSVINALARGKQLRKAVQVC